ncbi:MAG: N-acetylglucosamine-6-phosphate deacetylase [Clostridia bacterium]|nr:N-acetylglucosamine-6-phosphate deacetylase [Clostridia bacterium]
MIIKGKIFGTNADCLTIQGDKIIDIGKEIDGEVLDFGNMLVLPGFIDIHTHGAMGKDTMDGDDIAMQTIKKHMADHGVTSYCPTTVTMPAENICMSAKAAMRNRLGEGAEILGMHLEGPFYAEAYKGAQNPAYLRLPDVSLMQEILEGSEHFIRIVSLAPELKGASDVIRFLAENGVVVSAGHSAADYDTVMNAINYGLSHITHLYNAQSGLNHRTPNVTGAALSSKKVTAELICDGLHVHPAAARIAIAAKGVDRIALISDSISAAGMPDGTYSLGGQRVTVKEGVATIDNGTIAGGISNVFDCFCNVVRWGISIEDAVRMASENPARIVGATRKGKIRVGYDADLIVVNDRLELVAVIVRGQVWMNHYSK